MKWKISIPFILMFFICCQKQSATTSTIIPMNSDSSGIAVGNRYHYLALGDSYTIGQSVPESDRFPLQTANILSHEGVQLFKPDIIARTGWTTLDLSNAIMGAEITQPYDVVSLLIGVNDQYQLHDTTGYRERFRGLLKKSIAFAGDNNNHVFVLSIPDYSVTPFASGYDTQMIRRQLDWFNAINKEVTEQENCHYLDITPSTREAATDASLLAPDGLHPSGKEYGIWASGLAEQIKTVLP